MVAAHPTLLMLLSLKKVFLKGFFKELVFLKIQDFEFCFVHFELFFFLLIFDVYVFLAGGVRVTGVKDVFVFGWFGMC